MKKLETVDGTLPITSTVKLPHMINYIFVAVVVLSLSHFWLCDPLDSSTPDFSIHHGLLELAQTHVHWVSDVIQLSHPLSSPSPPAFSLSQHQGLFKWVGSFQMNRFFASGSQSIGASASASVLPMSIQGWFPLELNVGLIAVQETLKSLLQHHSS